MKKRRKKKMGALVKLPLKKSNSSMVDWLNDHFGADIDRAMHGDKKELKKSELHFDNKTIDARKKYNGES